MIEIIPNLHPIFVHFTVALFSLSVGLYVATLFMSGELKEQWLTVARWNLWFGAGFTILTGLSGLDAFNSVNHDTPSHEAMTEHRNWAVSTISLFLIATIWSIIAARRQQVLGTAFVIVMIAAGFLLASTAWHGGELVYRYGLGVMSLPKAEGEGHAHEHGAGAAHDGHAHDATQPSNMEADKDHAHVEETAHQHNDHESEQTHSDAHDHEH